MDPEALKVGQALKILRERIGLTQDDAAAAVEPGPISKQWWGMHEIGHVKAIFSPTVQRRLIDALNRAGNPEPPFTVDDLATAHADGIAETPAAKLARLARDLRPGRSADRGQAEDQDLREAVFPTRDGPVVFRYPGDLTPEGFKDLEAYFAVFLRTHTPN